MWKKVFIPLLVMIGALISSMGVYNYQMNAASGYHAGGNIAGRVVTAPTNINKASSVHYGFKQYDILEFNTMNTHVNKPLAFKLIEKETYTDYATTTCKPTDTSRCNNPAITAWYGLSNDPIDYLSMGMSASDFVINNPSLPSGYGNFSKSAVYASMKAMNTKIDANSKDKSYLTSRNFTHFHDILDSLRSDSQKYLRHGISAYNQIFSEDSKEEWLGSYLYTPSGEFAGATSNTVDKGYGFGSIYW